MALMALDDAQHSALHGFPARRVQQRPTATAPPVPALGELAPGLIRDWTRTNRLVRAVQIQKRMFIILALIVAVAAFNLVSTLVMTVTDKQADIAILRTLGATPRSDGHLRRAGRGPGVIGTLAGLLLGLLLAFNIAVIVPAIERPVFGTTFLPAGIYLIDHMPSDPRLATSCPSS